MKGQSMKRLPTGSPRVALLVMLLLLCTGLVHAVDDSVPASGYLPASGDRFFLLADSSFASDEEAQVRLEAPGRDYRRFALEGYGGADIRLYRIEQPLAFLKQQRNLHRLQFEADFRGEGLANTLAYLWDSWYRQSRRAMQRAFSFEARRTITEQAPELKVGEALVAPTPTSAEPQFAPIAGLPLIAEFRYPLWEAEPIQPPEGVELAGSSSHFIEAAPGNVHIPLGKLAPGLYVVEALIGNYRATTAVFVSDTVAITKIAGEELLVWTARKHAGTAVANVELLWTDGIGVMSSGRSDAHGLLRLTHASPERSYVIGEDADGGVFVSENFYYDSEIYDTKLYAFTDRPLYRPGDWVEVRMLARHFDNARDSRPAVSAPLALTVVDANGTELQTIDLQFDGRHGATSRFQLPANATAGGYELRMAYRDQLYAAAFRVAEYIKPHFEIVLGLDRPDHRTGEPVSGGLSLLYPDGKPVVDAHVQISLRAQPLTMVDNELQYIGQFPVELAHTELRSGKDGRVRLDLPAADVPSRYLLTVFASDGAAFRVRTSREILIERGAARYRIDTPRRFSAAGETVEFAYTAEQPVADGAMATDTAEPVRPVAFEWLRLEDRRRGGGALTAEDDRFSVRFDDPGTYTVQLKGERGLILGATGHSVSGHGVKALAGNIEIVFDRAEYSPGDDAQALLTFPEPVGEALLTLERDRVEQSALLSQGGDWLRLERISDSQFRAHIPVDETFAPNLTFSVLTTREGDYQFQNAGIKVRVAQIGIDIDSGREVYRPGEQVTIELATHRDGRPVSAMLAVSVVDEMIYALQPEIAPSIDDFFHHPRRNNVRTSASLAFVSYDVALPGRAAPPASGNRSERGVKVLERPRREDVDTAAWQPRLQTGADGRARFTFTMPDSLTRWRITARAIDDNGVVGQRRQFIRSEQPLYLTWSGPKHFREGDRPRLGLLAFNQQDAPADVVLQLTQERELPPMPLTLPPGVTWLPLPDSVQVDRELVATLLQEGAAADRLAVRLHAAGGGWPSRHSEALALVDAVTPLALPADASDIRLRVAGGARGLFEGALDDLLDYPHGCVEQTASRLLPLALAYPLMDDGEARVRDRLRLVLQTGRLRLVQMAGPNARFGWWGSDAAENAFMTAWAYHADWHASHALGLELATEHWQRVLELYSEQVATTPLLQRALILDFADTMQLPVTTLLQALLDELLLAGDGVAWSDASDRASLVLAAPYSETAIAIARVLAARLAQARDIALPDGFAAQLAAAERHLQGSPLLIAAAALQRAAPGDPADATALLARIAPEQATLERALMLSWLADAADAGALPIAVQLADGWQPQASAVDVAQWQWTAASVPDRLQLRAPPAQPLAARLSYDSADAAADTVPVTIQRRLWRLRPGATPFAFTAEAVTDGPLHSGSLYLDEVTLATTSDRPLRYGLLEVPLPPGADVERTTWGIEVDGLGGDAAAALEKARHEPGELSYALPVDALHGELRFRHLVRFSQAGEFTLPPSRYLQMYAPDRQAHEADPALARLRVE